MNGRLGRELPSDWMWIGPRIERVGPLTWIKGAEEWGGTFRQGCTFDRSSDGYVPRHQAGTNLIDRLPALQVRRRIPSCPVGSHRFIRLGCHRTVSSEENIMKKLSICVALVALVVGVAGISTSSQAETGRVAVIFTKGGLVVGVGGGEGVLTLRGKHYPFTVSGMSLGFTVGASATKFGGRALHLRGPASIEGTYSAAGAGGAVVAGAGGVQLQNANGVILQLSGPKVGAEVSAAVGGVTIRLK